MIPSSCVYRFSFQSTTDLLSTQVSRTDMAESPQTLLPHKGPTAPPFQPVPLHFAMALAPPSCPLCRRLGKLQMSLYRVSIEREHYLFHQGDATIHDLRYPIRYGRGHTIPQTAPLAVALQRRVMVQTSQMSIWDVDNFLNTGWRPVVCACSVKSRSKSDQPRS